MALNEEEESSLTFSRVWEDVHYLFHRPAHALTKSITIALQIPS